MKGTDVFRIYGSLFHAAAHLVRVFAGAACGFRNLDQLEHVYSFFPGSLSKQLLMKPDRLTYLVADAEEAQHRLQHYRSWNRQYHADDDGGHGIGQEMAEMMPGSMARGNP